jgi:putative Holliday junction resolvase
MPRVLGLDVGTKRIGVALSDSLGMIASPYQIVDSVSVKADALTISKLGESEEVEIYVVGMPYLMNGKVGGTGERIELFAKQLETLVQKPVHRFDERWTTAIAERALREGNLSRKARKEHRDAVAAAVILQGWLDIERRKNRAESEEYE